MAAVAQLSGLESLALIGVDVIDMNVDFGHMQVNTPIHAWQNHLPGCSICICKIVTRGPFDCGVDYVLKSLTQLHEQHLP